MQLNKHGRGSFFTRLNPDDYFKAVRKGMASAFSTETLKSISPKIRQKALELVQVIEKASPKGAIDFQELLPRCTLDIVALAGFGIDCQSLCQETPPLICAFRKVGDEMFADLYNPLRPIFKAIFPFSATAKESRRCLMEFYSEVDKKVAQLTPRDEVPPTDNSLWGCLSRIKDPRTGELLDHENLWGEFVVFLLAAMDTTGHQMSWALFCLATHPEIQQRVRDEMKDKGLLMVNGRCGISEMGYDEVMSLEYLTMVIKESLRFFPIAFGTVRQVVKDGEKICGYRVPKGVVIRTLPLVMHHLPSLWENPEEFIPERFSKQTLNGGGNGNNESTTRSSKGTRKFWAFSDGTRDCMGQRMGMVEMQTILATLLSKFNFRYVHHCKSY